ncbi:hypothetical protein CRUP_010272 [Coryphaenoides rupestris]|nr:hypothetical protein CRUP_010272 [Coryphaenoides rupestris]
MPDSPTNQRLGMFMVRMTCYSRGGRRVTSSAHSTMLHYHSDLLRTVSTLLFLPVLLSGAAHQTQWLEVELFSDYTQDPFSPCVEATVEVLSSKLPPPPLPCDISTVIDLQAASNVNMADVVEEESTDEDEEAKSRCEMTNDEEDNGHNEPKPADEEEDKESPDPWDEPQERLPLRGHALHRTFKRRHNLRSTKSFPPYNQPIGGLGYDGESDPESEGDYEMPPTVKCGGPRYSLPHFHDETADVTLKSSSKRIAEDTLLLEQPVAFRLDAWQTPSRCCSREEWRARLRQSSGVGMRGTEDVERGGGVTMDKWERRERWIGSRRPKETGGRGGGGEETRTRRDMEKAVSDERVKDQEEGDTNGTYSKTEEEKGLIFRRGTRAERRNWQQGVDTDVCQPHLILAKLLHFSSSSSFSLYPAESEEVHSDGEDTDSMQKTLRKLGDGGEVLKLYSEAEATCLELLMADPLRPFVPRYHGLLTRGEERFVRLQDLLGGLTKPEDEVERCCTLRSDMYYKMLKADPGAPSVEEHEQGAVTKWRYMRWRDTTSSTSTLGFRIEGIMTENGGVQRDFRKMQSLAQVTEVLLYFTSSRLDILVIGSSLLFVHDHIGPQANVWMIDFGKTTPTPDSTRIRHNVQWVNGNREDGYLIGLASLTSSLHQAITLASQSCSRPTENA